MEDPAVSRPSSATRRRPIVHRRLTGGGKGLAILRPGVLRLTVNCAPPFAPPPFVATPYPPPTFRVSHPRAVDPLSGGGYGGAKTAWNGVGGRYRSPPPPHALRRSDSDYANCCETDKVMDKSSPVYFVYSQKDAPLKLSLCFSQF